MTSLARRDVLKCLPVVAGAAVTGTAVTGTAAARAAGSRGSALRADADAGFPQPETRRADPDTGRLATRLTVAFTELAVPGVGSVLTRAYEGSVPGPTLRVRPGETLEIMQVNALPPNAEAMREAHPDMNVPHHFNTFNLHTHGMHVDPSGEADNVFRAFEPAAVPGTTTAHRSIVDVPADHPAGTFWYHPHLHGSTSSQLLSGMAGVLVVEGDVDEVPEIAAAKEVVVCVSELKLSGGRVPDLTSHGVWDDIPSTFLVNGAKNPVLTIAPGEIQRWRVVNAGALTAHFLSVGGQEMHQIACDGVTFMKPVATTGVTLPMGGRVDLLVRGGRPGTYKVSGGGPSHHLFTLVVTGAPRTMSLPAELPGRPTELPEPTRTRTLTFRSYENVFSGAFPNAYRILGDGETPPADPGAGRDDLAWGRLCADYVNQRVRLGEVEEWTIVNDSHAHAHSHHPFHLHTNHFLLTAVDNRKLATPVWHDTVAVPPNGSITFRLRAEDFTGRSMLHCHQLQHGDEGMMQIVDYVR
ncbi:MULTISPECIES: multicopper oxidase family protein [unclassified Streptomyces]|uniref:multicopper oxidase family protein n=1 Tax=unclassified Streptomyces TaxID=2593676 RepID=UPI002E22B610